MIQTSVNFRSESVNEEQNANSHFTNRFVAVVFFVSTYQKLYSSSNDCGDGSNIQNESLNKFVGEEFHNEWGVGVSVENLNHECTITG